MKKTVKITLITVGVLFLVLLIDTAQALAFDNSPLLKIREYYNGGDLYYKDKGLLVDTYCRTNGNEDTVIKWFGYSISDINRDEEYKNTEPMESNLVVDICDRAEEEKIPCDTALEKFFEDEYYGYYFSVIKSQHVIVTYQNGETEDVVSALNSGKISISDLNEFGIRFQVRSKTK